MAIDITVTGKCVGCPRLSPSISTLYANDEPKELIVTCENKKLCDHIEEHLERNKWVGGDPLHNPF